MKHLLGIVDYIVISISLAISAGIGIASVYYGTHRTAKEYILADKTMTKIPVILSIMVTLTSPISFIGTPAEIYRYGFQYMIATLSLACGILLASWIFIPVYYQCGVTTVNEYLEMRFGRILRYIVSGLFLIQMVFFMSTALYGGVLALSTVTNLSQELSIASLAIICAFYCSLGGLKAVLWTDVYQAVLMIICLLLIFEAGIGESGGISNIFSRAKEGQRLDIFDFQLDLLKRYSFWGCLCRGLMGGMANFGTNQIEVQRILSVDSSKKAERTLRFSIVPVMLMFSLCNIFGLVLYSIHYHCDPILNKEQSGLTNYDQLVPSYIVTKFSSIPGMTGLCIAGIFGASLSTVSSALNSASTVTVIDLIKPLFKEGTITDSKTVWLAKLFSILYGGLCIALCFSFLGMKSLHQLGTVVVAGVEGPMAAVFLFGVLTRKATDKCASFAMILGYSITAWIAFGSLYSKHRPAALPLSIDMCPALNASDHFNITLFTYSNHTNNLTESSMQLTADEPFLLYKISFLWHSSLGFILTLIFISLASMVTGWKKYVIPEDSKCLSPVTNLWLKKPEQRYSVAKEELELNDNVEPLLLQNKI